MFCYAVIMSLLDQLDLHDIVNALIEGGDLGHDIAVAHSAERGSNPFTFGNDRYHRSSEITKDLIEFAGFKPYMVGGGHRARRGDVELWFATAKGVDVSQRTSFDFTTDARMHAGSANVQPFMDGLGEEDLPSRPIVHVVWSGDSINGMTAVHLGKLARIGVGLIDWNPLVRIDSLHSGIPTTNAPSVMSAQRSYDDQPEPTFDLAPLTFAQAPSDDR
jgi:hypothetical protein